MKIACLSNFGFLFGIGLLTTLLSGCDHKEIQQKGAKEKRVLVLSIIGQLPLEGEAALPIAFQNDLIMADGAGSVIRLNPELQPLWRVVLDDTKFANSGIISAGRLLLCSRKGQVFCVNPENGAVVWKKSLDALFSHEPLCGEVKGEPVVWLLSQSDGVLYALKIADGTQLWSSVATNRSEGNAVIWHDKIAYGNCDGAIHLFNAITGEKSDSIPIGDSAQMAGTPLVTTQGALWVVTREGTLALVDLATEKLIAVLKVSDEEAFVQPVQVFDNQVAMGVSEGRLYLCHEENGEIAVMKEAAFPEDVKALLYDGNLLYVLAKGTLHAVNAKLQTEASLNVGDAVSGAMALGNGLLVAIADQSLLVIKGEWQ